MHTVLERREVLERASTMRAEWTNFLIMWISAGKAASGVIDRFLLYCYTNKYQLIFEMNDPMQDNSKGYGWDQYTTNATACQSTAGTYEINTPIHVFHACYARSSPQFSNFVLEAQMKIVKGDCGAIIFRTDSTNGNFYEFEVCQNGIYDVNLHISQASPPF